MFWQFLVANLPGEIGAVRAPTGSVISTDKNLNEIFGFLRDYFLGFSASIAVICLVAAGIMWAAAAGDEEKIARAKNLIRYSLVGVAIISTSTLVVSVLLRIFGE